jgi:hypothetical protein
MDEENTTEIEKNDGEGINYWRSVVVVETTGR